VAATREERPRARVRASIRSLQETLPVLHWRPRQRKPCGSPRRQHSQLLACGVTSEVTTSHAQTQSQSCQKAACAKGIMHVGRRDIEREGQTQGIHHQMTLTTFDTFVSIIAADTTCLLHGLDALCIYNGRARVWIPADPSALGLPQRAVEAGPEAGAAKPMPMIVHDLPRREIARQVAPRTARAQHIKQRIEDRAEGMPAESPTLCSWHQAPLEAVSFSVR
jgi:hypothetical protein